MPIREIQVKEYECSWCKYRWINRLNGNDGPIPDRCAKCKRKHWENGEADYIGLEEDGLRRRVRGFESVYSVYDFKTHDHEMDEWPKGLAYEFLKIRPRPTVSELKRAVYPLGWNVRKYRNMIPDPDKPGYLKYDDSRWIRDPNDPEHLKRNPDYKYGALLREERQKRIATIVAVMKSRGVHYDPNPILEQQKKRYLQKVEEEAAKRQPSYEELTGVKDEPRSSV